MRKTVFLVFFLTLGVFLIFFLQAANADEFRGMVIKLEDGGVKVNLGKNKGVLVGTELYVYRVDKAIGRIKIVQIDDYYSMCEVVKVEPGSEIKIGDTVRSSELKSEYVSAGTGVNKSDEVNVEKKTAEENEVCKKDKIPNFEAELNRYTRLHIFKVKAPEQNLPQSTIPGYPTISTNPMNPVTAYSTNPTAATVFDVLSTAGYIALYSNPNYGSFFNNNWLAYTSLGGSLYARYEMLRQSRKVAGAGKKAYMEITYWNENLVNEYADYYAYKEAFDDETLKEKIRKGMKNEKGMKDNIVFEIRIKNEAKGAVHLAPFDWHIYLVGPDGVRYKAEKYDKSLDNSLSTNQSTAGFVYFKRIDFGGGPIKIILEDIYGENKAFTW